MHFSKIRATYTPSHRRSINVWSKILQVGRGGGQKLNKLRRKSGGVIALEVCFTLPVVVYLIFFTIELIKINITQDALQSICEEATYLTIAHDYENGEDLINKIDAIIEKYRPTFIPAKAPGYAKEVLPVIRWYYWTYISLDEMLKNIPYGGATVAYPYYEWGTGTYSRWHASPDYRAGVTEYIPTLNNFYTETPNRNCEDTFSYMKSAGLPNNRVFVITFVCNYPFSNSLVKWLFNGGVNTKKAVSDNYHGSANNHKKGTMYLLWARGAGIVNAK